MRKSALLVSLSLVTLAVGCDRSTSPVVVRKYQMTGSLTREPGRPFKKVSVTHLSAQELQSYVPGSRAGEEEAAIRRILELSAPPDREWMEQHVRNHLSFVSEHPDPEIADLLGKIYSIRQADGEATQLAGSRSYSRSHSLRVVVALSESARFAGTSATIVRAPGPPSIVAIVMNKGTASEDALAGAIGALQSLREAEGDLVSRLEVVPIRQHAGIVTWSDTRKGIFHDLLTKLSSAPVRDIPGVGPAQTVVTTLPAIK